jgi:hypothetical protein
VSHFDDEEDGEVPKVFGLETGYVVDRDDPEGLGRVRVCIPGLLEPYSAWALPLGGGGGTSKDRGEFSVPRLNAEVGVFFKRGNIERPYYLASNWGKPNGQSDVPPEAQGKVDNRVISTETFAIELDETEGSRKCKLSCRKTGDFIEINAEDNTMTLSATTALNIAVVGALNIQALQVTINGRVVETTGKPI